MGIPILLLGQGVGRAKQARKRKMILLSHPFGNAFSRALLTSLQEAGKLESFHTSLSFPDNGWLITAVPGTLRRQLRRRTYNVPGSKIVSYPFLEAVRLTTQKLGLAALTAQDSGWASFDAVSRNQDQAVARYVLRKKSSLTGVYCYEDAAYHTFQAAKECGLKCYYELPIAYCDTVQKLLRQEAERLPEWSGTLGAIEDSVEKLSRKAEELRLADLVICPSRFVYDSLPESIRAGKECIVSEFGSPPVKDAERKASAKADLPLRVLFAGAMTQRKGLADLFAAMKRLEGSDIELVVMGSPIEKIDFYRSQFPSFIHEPPRPHKEVLTLMKSCDLLVLPSIVEGRALVQQEAMMCGLPIIVTRNAGGEDLVEEGKTGFLVPIRSPEAIAEKISWIASNRDCLSELSSAARQKAAEVTWENYCRKILDAITRLSSGNA
jgi:glycosyltransferase involved in cell wall biosynthesis